MAGEKTEKATPKRRSEARSRGQVARWPEVASAAVFAAALAALSATAPRLLRELENVVGGGLARIANPGLVTPSGIADIAQDSALSVARAAAPVLLAAAVAGLLANVAQVKLKVTPKAIAPSLKKLDPIAGAKRLFGPHGLVEGGKSLLKVAAVGLAVLVVLKPRLG